MRGGEGSDNMPLRLPDWLTAASKQFIFLCQGERKGGTNLFLAFLCLLPTFPPQFKLTPINPLSPSSFFRIPNPTPALSRASVTFDRGVTGTQYSASHVHAILLLSAASGDSDAGLGDTVSTTLPTVK